MPTASQPELSHFNLLHLMQVVGENGVLFLELADSTVLPGAHFRISDVVASYLTRGDQLTISE